MSSSIILERIRNLIAEQCDVKIEAIDKNTTLDDMGVDSLESVELIMEIEQEFKVEIPDEDSASLDTVGKMTAYLNARAA